MMIRTFWKLKTLLFEKEITQHEICKKIKKSKTYLTDRMMARRPFELDVVYQICDFLDIPYNEIPSYFPPGGISGTLKGRHEKEA